MKLLGAVILVAFAGVVVWFNRSALGLSHLVFAGMCLTGAGLLAMPRASKRMLATMAKYLPIARGSAPPSP